MLSEVGPQPEKIRNLFSSISNTYDLANDVITGGRARSWRKDVVKWSGAFEGHHVLDCASGTGDLALEFKNIVTESGRVVASDFCAEMLEKVKPKAVAKGLVVETVLADAEQLPFSDRSFDICSISYGIRNVSRPLLALSEMARVVKKNGVVVILETGQIQTPVLGSAMRFYFRNVVPRLGGWVSGNRQAYEYLNQSSSAFPCREEFLDLMKQTGKFAKLEYKSLMGGASYMYRGLVI